MLRLLGSAVRSARVLAPAVGRRTLTSTAAAASAGSGKSAEDRIAELEAEVSRLKAQQRAPEMSSSLADFATEMISVQDDLERCISLIPPEELRYNKHLHAIHSGLVSTSRNFMTRLEKFGIKRIPTVGEKWDPQLHMAVFEMEDPATEPGVICQVVKQGYTYQGRVLRLAEVAIATEHDASAPKYTVSET